MMASFAARICGGAPETNVPAVLAHHIDQGLYC